MTDKIKNELRATEELRLAELNDVEKFQKSYAKYIIADQDNIRNNIVHPYVVTKKDIRKKKFQNFLNKLKKAFGL